MKSVSQSEERHGVGGPCREDSVSKGYCIKTSILKSHFVGNMSREVVCYP